ncbi:hypothetical protein [Spongiimicrobium salis]
MESKLECPELQYTPSKRSYFIQKITLWLSLIIIRGAAEMSKMK